MSIRGRLTVAYAILLVGTLIVFAIALESVYGSRASSFGSDARQTTDSVVGLIRQRQVALNALQQAQGAPLPPDSQLTVWLREVQQGGGATLNARPTDVLKDLLRRAPGYFLVYNNQGLLIYASPPMSALSKDDQEAVMAVANKLTPGGVEGALLNLRGDSTRLYLVSQEVSTSAIPVPNISRVVAGSVTSFADLLAPSLGGTILVLAPLLFLLSLAAAYAVLGNVFRPVDDLINEVEAITDGRSLHRRVPTDALNDELSRLSLTLNAMLARLETSFVALRRFTADASHELKTPLTVLRADVERAIHPSTSRVDRSVALEEALQETARMSDLVNALLTLARGDEGRFDIHRTPIELEPLIREVYETAVILGEEGGLTLSLDPLENGIVMGDRTRLRQLLLNLVTNAIKYTPRGGHVDLSVTRRSDDEIAIAVRDTGIGISPADLPHVFDRFWRADRVRSRASERGGFGLGLSIAQWIVHAHGGSISVQSRLGRGTVFTVLLPVVASGSPESGDDSASAATDAMPAEVDVTAESAEG